MTTQCWRAAIEAGGPPGIGRQRHYAHGDPLPTSVVPSGKGGAFEGGAEAAEGG